MIKLKYYGDDIDLGDAGAASIRLVEYTSVGDLCSLTQGLGVSMSHSTNYDKNQLGLLIKELQKVHAMMDQKPLPEKVVSNDYSALKKSSIDGLKLLKRGLDCPTAHRFLNKRWEGYDLTKLISEVRKELALRNKGCSL